MPTAILNTIFIIEGSQVIILGLFFQRSEAISHDRGDSFVGLRVEFEGGFDS